MKKIFVVRAGIYDYDGYKQWNLFAFTTREESEDFKVKCELNNRNNIKDYEKSYKKFLKKIQKNQVEKIKIWPEPPKNVDQEYYEIEELELFGDGK